MIFDEISGIQLGAEEGEPRIAFQVVEHHGNNNGVISHTVNDYDCALSMIPCEGFPGVSNMEELFAKAFRQIKNYAERQ